MHSIYSLCKRLQQSFSNSKMAADKPSKADDKDRDCSVSLLSQPHRIIEEKQHTIKGKRRKRRRLCCCCLVCMTSCLIALAVILMFVVLFSDHTLSLRWHLSEKFGINLPDYQKPTSLGKRYCTDSFNVSQSWLRFVQAKIWHRQFDSPFGVGGFCCKDSETSSYQTEVDISLCD